VAALLAQMVGDESVATEADLWQLVVSERQGVLATVARDGRPQLSNVLYEPDADGRIVRISTTADRLKARNLARDPRAALHVSGPDFWHYAVAEGGVTLSAVASDPGDDACRELLAVHTAFYGEQDADAAYADLIAARRLVVRLHVSHLYGVMTTAGARPASRAGSAG
jgi:PPOX class probable F420-dependent enzyme